MRELTGAFFQSLDGVIQAPGGPTEDPTGGFAHGGWLAGLADDGIEATIGELFAPPYALLLGRRTYDIFAAYWPYIEGEEAAMGEALTRADKYVLTAGDQPLEWANSHRLASLDDVAALKAGDGPRLLIQGSSTLYPALLARGLIDRLVTMTFPVVLGGGKRAFDHAAPARTLTMVEHRVTAKGAVIATYRPAGPVRTGAFGLVDSPAERARQRRMAHGDW